MFSRSGIVAVLFFASIWGGAACLSQQEHQTQHDSTPPQETQPDPDFDNALPWQCRPGSIDLNALYPELVAERDPAGDLGEGTDGLVYLSPSNSTDDAVPKIAIKRFNPETTIEHEIRHEYWIGRASSHDNIARTYSLSYVDSESKRDEEEKDEDDADNDAAAWQMSMEYIAFPLIDLLDYDAWASRPWTFQGASCVFQQLGAAVSFMHSSGFAHRDLKVENIMVDRSGVVKLIDFGSAAASRNGLLGKRLKSSENWVGTPITMAPEVHEVPFFDMEKADVWSLAVVLLRLWVGRYPWEPEGVLGSLWEDSGFVDFLEERENVGRCGEGARNIHDAENWKDENNQEILCRVPDEARNVMERMFEVDPEKRLELKEVMDSKWMRETARLMGGDL